MIVYHRMGGERVFVLKEHLDHYYDREQQRDTERHGLTGREIVEMARLTVIVGPLNSYNWQTKVVTLTARVAGGTDCYARCCAHHECVHARQPEWVLALASIWYYAQTHGWLARLVTLPLWPFYYWSEMNAWQSVFGGD